MSARFSLPLTILALLEGAIFVAVFAAVHAAVQAGLPGVVEEPFSPLRAVLIAALIVLLMFALGLYTWHRANDFADILARILFAFGLACVTYGAAVYLVGALRVPPHTLAPAVVLAVPAVFGARVAFLHVADLNVMKRRIVVIGTSRRAACIQELESRSDTDRFVVFAFIELESMPVEVDPERVVSMPNDLTGYCQDHGVEEVVVAMEDRRGRMPLEPLVSARLAGLRLTDYQDFNECALGRVDLDALWPSWFLFSPGFRNRRVHRAGKRALDVATSLGLLTFTLPLLIATAVAIKLESRGPILYTQERVGQGGRLFRLYKFRSMCDDAERGGSPQWAQAEDPRVTRVGRVIRITRIDELPQVINVLAGHMSFVGPRPERPFFVEQLDAEIPFHRERTAVKPGITGWAQLNYPYGASAEDAKQKLQYDLFYIKHFSIIFDLAIVLQTMRVVLWGQGAR